MNEFMESIRAAKARMDLAIAAAERGDWSAAEHASLSWRPVSCGFTALISALMIIEL